MSQFFDQYNAILEKSLQKVRLKVDPSNKCAEDFAHFDGYVGYILAETDESIEFFYDNQTVTLPKTAVFVEDWKSTLGTGAANFIRGAAGQNTGSSLAGAFGSMASSAAKNVGKAALALHGIDPRMLSSQQQQKTTTPGSGLKFDQSVDRSQAFKLTDTNGFASIKVANVPYGFLQIAYKNKNLMPESFNFLMQQQFSLLEQQTLPYSGLSQYQGQPNAKVIPPASAPARKPSLYSTKNQPPVLDAEVVDNKHTPANKPNFIKLSQLQLQKDIFNTNLVVYLAKIENNEKKQAESLQSFLEHTGRFMQVGGSPEIMFVFSD